MGREWFKTSMASTSISLDAEFRRVVDDFKAKAELTPEELQYFRLSKLDDVTAILATIQKKQSQTGRLTYMKRIDPFLKTILEFGSVVEVFLNTSDILAFVWVCIVIRLIASQRVDTYLT